LNSNNFKKVQGTPREGALFRSDGMNSGGALVPVFVPHGGIGGRGDVAIPASGTGDGDGNRLILRHSA